MELGSLGIVAEELAEVAAAEGLATEMVDCEKVVVFAGDGLEEDGVGRFSFGGGRF